MKRYEVTFCAPVEEKGRTFIARAVVGANQSDEAARLAYDHLKPKYPEIDSGEWLAVYSDQALHIPDSPTELPFGLYEEE